MQDRATTVTITNIGKAITIRGGIQKRSFEKIYKASTKMKQILRAQLFLLQRKLIININQKALNNLKLPL